MQIPNAIDPVEALKADLADALIDSKVFAGETTVIVAPEKIVEVALYLRNTVGLTYNFLSDISAVDYYPEADRSGRFGVSYHLYSMLYNRRIRLKTFVQEDTPELDSVVSVWPGANWLEREIHDLMGIYFNGHPDMRRLLLPDDWDGHPHRRDYPLGYEQIQFSFNADEIRKHKPRATK